MTRRQPRRQMSLRRSSSSDAAEPGFSASRVCYWKGSATAMLSCAEWVSSFAQLRRRSSMQWINRYKLHLASGLAGQRLVFQPRCHMQGVPYQALSPI